jgi:hypothetical protein
LIAEGATRRPLLLRLQVGDDFAVVLLGPDAKAVDKDRHPIAVANLQAGLLAIVVTRAKALAGTAIATQEIDDIKSSAIELTLHRCPPFAVGHARSTHGIREGYPDLPPPTRAPGSAYNTLILGVVFSRYMA